MNRTNFLEFAEEAYKRCMSILKIKNNDYSQEENPFSNFETQASIAGIDTYAAFRAELGRKMARIREQTSGGSIKVNSVKEESVEDTLFDLANYAILFAAYIKQERKNAKI